MKAPRLISTLSLPALLLALALPSHAHDPSEHMKDAENPDCSAMEGMDHSQMDPSDPIAQAMMQKCMQELHEEAPDGGDPEPRQDEGQGTEPGQEDSPTSRSHH